MQRVLLCIENITAKESKLLTKQATLETKLLKNSPTHLDWYITNAHAAKNYNLISLIISTYNELH